MCCPHLALPHPLTRTRPSRSAYPEFAALSSASAAGSITPALIRLGAFTWKTSVWDAATVADRAAGREVVDDPTPSSVEELRLPSRGIRHIAGIEQLTALAVLDLSGNEISSCDGIQALSALKEVRSTVQG